MGINTAIIQGAQNVGFSIAIDSVEELIDDLKAGGGDLTPNTPVPGFTTVDVSSPDLPQEFKDQFGITAEQGAIVGSVVPDSSAAKAGIQVGDVVVAFDGTKVTGSAQLTKLVREHKPGDQVTVEVERRGEPRSFTITIGP